MQSLVINTREDLDALEGTPEHEAAMQLLAGALWRLEKDDEARAWRAVQDTSTIERFGLSLEDFPDATPPELPAYAPPAPTGPSVVSMRQARLALLQAGLLEQAQAAIASMDGIDGDVARIEWQYASEVRREQPLVQQLAIVLGLDEAALDDLFTQAAAL